jgi:hypothetical protein
LPAGQEQDVDWYVDGCHHGGDVGGLGQAGNKHPIGSGVGITAYPAQGLGQVAGSLPVGVVRALTNSCGSSRFTDRIRAACASVGPMASSMLTPTAPAAATATAAPTEPVSMSTLR